jgi:hypothetical protein
MAGWDTSNIQSYYGDKWAGMAPELQTLAKQYALADQNLNGGTLPDFASFTPAQSTHASYGGALPAGLGRVVAGSGGGFGLGSGKFHPEGYELVADPRGAEDFSIARAVAFQNDPSRYDSRWGGSAWTGDDMWLTSPGGATFARSDLLNPNLTDADIIARNQQYASGELTPTAAIKGATGEGTPLYYFNDPAGAQAKSADDAAAVKQAAAIRGEVPNEVAANNAVIAPQIQREMTERLTAMLPDVKSLKYWQNLDGSINYDYMSSMFGRGQTPAKPAWYDSYATKWQEAASSFGQPAAQAQAPTSTAATARPGLATPTQSYQPLQDMGIPQAPQPQSYQPTTQPSAAPVGTMATRADLGGWEDPAVANLMYFPKSHFTGQPAQVQAQAASGTPSYMMANQVDLGGWDPTTAQYMYFPKSHFAGTPLDQPSQSPAATPAAGSFPSAEAYNLPATTGGLAALGPTQFAPQTGISAGGAAAPSPTGPSVDIGTQIGNYFNNASGAQLGGLIGTAVPIPGAGVAGRAIGAAYDYNQGANQLTGAGGQNTLGFTDWGKAALGITPISEAVGKSAYAQGVGAGPYPVDFSSFPTSAPAVSTPIPMTELAAPSALSGVDFGAYTPTSFSFSSPAPSFDWSGFSGGLTGGFSGGFKRGGLVK